MDSIVLLALRRLFHVMLDIIVAPHISPPSVGLVRQDTTALLKPTARPQPTGSQGTFVHWDIIVRVAAQLQPHVPAARMGQRSDCDVWKTARTVQRVSIVQALVW